MTKSQTMATLAEKTGLSKKQTAEFLDELNNLAYKEAKNGFTIPGLGKLVLATSAPREMVMRFGPKAGQTVKVRFRLGSDDGNPPAPTYYGAIR